MLARAIEKAKVWRWSRNQMFSEPLRAHFRKNYAVDVGLYSYGCFDPWRMSGPLKIGRYCSIAKTARMVPRNHPYTALSTHPFLYEAQFGIVEEEISPGETLRIEDDVWIGHYAVILPGCKFIGRGAIIGAGAIVTRNVPAYTIVAGNPARKLKDRFSPAMVEAIEETRWWELSMNELRMLVVREQDAVFAPTSNRLRDLPSMKSE